MSVLPEPDGLVKQLNVFYLFLIHLFEFFCYIADIVDILEFLIIRETLKFNPVLPTCSLDNAYIPVLGEHPRRILGRLIFPED